MNLKQSLDQAIAHHQAGRLGEAEAIYRQILSQEPNHPDAMHLLGVVAYQINRHDDAIELFKRAILLSPGAPEYRNHLGLALAATGRLDDAIQIHQQTLSRWPNHVPTLTNLGNAFKDAGHCDPAIQVLQRALELDPSAPETCTSLGNALFEVGQIDRSIAAHRRALQLRADYPEAHNNLGNALLAAGEMDAAIEHLRRAVALRPAYAQAHNNLGNLLREAGLLNDALASFDRAIAIEPAQAAFHSNRVYTLNYHPGFDAASIARELAQWNARHAAPLRQSHQVHANDRAPGRRLRIGYVSADFRDHVVGWNLLPLLREHDHQKFQVFCYASVARPDATTARFQKHADVWRSLFGISDEQAARVIREDQIDILVDLSLHSAHNRLLVFARKPAPIQATFGGYPGSTGMDAIDYRLSDPHLDPPGQSDAQYAEKTVRLPASFWCYDADAMGLAGVPAVSAPPALQNRYVTFGCLNSFSKLNDGVLELWSAVMERVPNSHLMLLAPRGDARARLLTKLQARGIAPLRVEFADRQSRMAYFQMYHRIDIGLDTLPYNGHTTALDSFWMGVPVVSLAGQNAVGRGGKSILSNLGLSELCAENSAEFVSIAAELAGSPARLGDLRAGLRQRLQSSALANASQFARGIEAAYQQMWADWCQGVTADKV